MGVLNPREAAFVVERMSEIESSESRSPTEKTEAKRVRAKLERTFIE